MEPMEPERKIEKWLRAYAKKRRGQAGEPFSLHPATRRMLQGETARNAPKPDDRKRASSLLRKRWVLGWGLAFCLLLVAALCFRWMTMNTSEIAGTSETLSMKDIPASVRDRMEGESENAAASSAGNSSRQMSDKILSKNFKRDLESTNPVAPGNLDNVYANNSFGEVTNQNSPLPSAAGGLSTASTPPVEMPPPAPASTAVSPESPVAEMSPGTSTIGNAAGAPTVAYSTPNESTYAPANPNGQLPVQTNSVTEGTAFGAGPAVASGTPASLSGYYQEKSSSLQLENRFQNSFKNTITRSPSGPLLVNFQVEQNGSDIRIVDADGSVYEGTLMLTNRGEANETRNTGGGGGAGPVAPPALATADTAQSAQPAGVAGSSPSPQYYFFQVNGMNRTLKQKVVFTGKLLVLNTTRNLQQKAATDLIQNRSASNYVLTKSNLANQGGQLPWSNLLITGTAVVNDTNHIPVNATPLDVIKN
jgi:hypothetical protein